MSPRPGCLDRWLIFKTNGAWCLSPPVRPVRPEREKPLLFPTFEAARAAFAAGGVAP